MDLSRRRFLGAAAALLPGCSVRRRVVAPPPAGIHLARVEVAPDRVIRSTVGLRPSGFVGTGRNERGVWNTDVDAATTARILRENGALFGAMRG